MRSLFLSLLLAAAAVAANAADAPSLNGKWKIHISVAGNERDAECTFTQKDTDLSGSCTSDQGATQFSGKVDGAKVSWTYKSDYQGTPITLNYQGTLDSAKITGTVEVPEYSVAGDFTAVPAK